MMNFLKGIPRGTWDVLLLLTVLVKVAASPLNFASALLLMPVTILYVTKFMIQGERRAFAESIEGMRKEVADCKYTLKLSLDAQAQVFRQADETKAVISKLNLSSAFTPRSQRKQD